jgi:uncharacterized protein (TIGR00645 family)
MESLIERVLFASRWLLVPLYLGMAALLVIFSLAFFKELYLVAGRVFSMGEEELILSALTFVDLSLVASLIVMVMLSGYENFVSRIDVAAAEQNMAWLGKLDVGSLKIKVAASIVAISSVRLLKEYMNAHADPGKLMLLGGLHLIFIVSALLLAITDRISGASTRPGSKP